MHIVATFEHSNSIELAIMELEQMGIDKNHIMVLPLHMRHETKLRFDTLHTYDGNSIMDLPAILGTCLMLLGCIYGYVLKWGPIIWGLIGIILGIGLGFAIKLFLHRHSNRGAKRIQSEVMMMIRCEAHQEKPIQQILWSNMALGLASHHS